DDVAQAAVAEPAGVRIVVPREGEGEVVLEQRTVPSGEVLGRLPSEGEGGRLAGGREAEARVRVRSEERGRQARIIVVEPGRDRGDGAVADVDDHHLDTEGLPEIEGRARDAVRERRDRLELHHR